MARGEAFADRHRRSIEQVRAEVEARTGIEVSVYVGRLRGGSGSRAAAETLHADLGAAAPRTVLVTVDPAARCCEIVTGTELRVRLDERSCALVVLAMTSSFAAGDLAGGLVQGLRMLGDAAGVSVRTR